MANNDDSSRELVSENKTKETKRYASIDFLRGASIFLMIVLHTINDTLDIPHYIDNLNDVGSVNLVALISLPYIGGLAGLFLMTSAVGNMIAISRNLEKGHAIGSIVRKQVVVGFLIVFFAMIAEGALGNHSTLGEVAKHLDDISSANWEAILYRGYNFEAIHAIGWAIVVNGIVQGIISRFFDINSQRGKMIQTYWILSIIVLIATPFIWNLVSQIIPNYPFGKNPLTGQDTIYPYIGLSPWYDFITLFFLNPLAAPMEPIFPYMATSFIGSIIGLQLTKPQDSFDRKFLRRYFKLGLIAFLVGFAGVVVVLVNVMNKSGLDVMLEKFQLISYHRHWTWEQGLDGGWIWQFLTLNGVSLMLTVLALRLVEYRGNSSYFAKKSTFIRRFGFIALTAYTIQWIYFIVQLIVNLLIGLEPYARVSWMWTWVICILTILAYHFIMKGWERKGYIGSMEWGISTIASKLTKIKRQATYREDGDKPKWYERGKLNVDDIFYNASWQNFEVEDKVSDDLRLIKYSAIAGFILFPFSFVALKLVNDMKRDHPDRSIKSRKIATWAGVIFFLLWFILGQIFSLNQIGIPL